MRKPLLPIFILFLTISGAGAQTVALPAAAAGAWYCARHKVTCLAAGAAAVVVYQNRNKVASGVAAMIENKAVGVVASVDLPHVAKSRCSDDELSNFSARVGQFCKKGIVKACKTTDTKADAVAKASIFEQCIRARTERENRCFGGGDAGHRQQIDELSRGLNKCLVRAGVIP